MSEWENEWRNDQEEAKATNEETRGIVCVLYDVWEDGSEWVSEWVRGIEEEEEEEAELAEVLLIVLFAAAEKK